MIPKTPLVVDLYHGDRVTDFAALNAAGIAGIIHKAQQGASPNAYDPTYDIRRRSARAAGLLWGAYLFMTNDDPALQAATFMKAASPDALTLLAVDFEPYGRRTPTLQQLRIILQEILRIAGRKAVIYSGSLLKETLGAGKDEFLGSHRLWLAEYAEHWKLEPLTAWKQPWLWQFTGDGVGPTPHSVPGIQGAGGHVDLNSYDGPDDELAREWAS
jgi:lysozyme